MRNSKQNEFETRNKPEPIKGNAVDALKISDRLVDDKEFIKLRQAYQNADFSACGEILARLEVRYPDQSQLRKYREEVQIRKTLKSIETHKKNSELRKKKTKGLRLSLFAMASTLLVIAAFLISYSYFNNKVSAKQLQEETTQLARLTEQIDQLLLVGKPRSAAEVLEKVRIIDPAYQRLPELETQTYNLLLHEMKYQTAISLLGEGKDQEALKLFQEIETDWPGLWDVRQRIDALESPTQSKEDSSDVQVIFHNLRWESETRQKSKSSRLLKTEYRQKNIFQNFNLIETLWLNSLHKQNKSGKGVT